MFLIVQAKVIRGESGDRRIEWTNAGLSKGDRERFYLATADDPRQESWNLTQIESRVSRHLSTSESVWPLAVSWKERHSGGDELRWSRRA